MAEVDQDSLDTFLKNIDDVKNLIQSLKNDDPAAMEDADKYLEKKQSKGFDKTVINKSKGGESKNARKDATPEQAAFFASMEQDAAERAARRRLREARAEKRKIMGNEAFQEGDYKTAVEMYTDAIAECPENPVLYTNRAQAHLKLEHYHRALKNCDQALNIDKKSVKGWVRKGLALKGLSKFQEALESFRAAVKLVPPKKAGPIHKHIDETKKEQVSKREEVKAMEAEATDIHLQSIGKCIQRLSNNSEELTTQEMVKISGELSTLLARDDLSKIYFRAYGGLKILTLHSGLLRANAKKESIIALASLFQAIMVASFKCPINQDVIIVGNTLPFVLECLVHEASVWHLRQKALTLLVTLVVDGDRQLENMARIHHKQYIENLWACCHAHVNSNAPYASEELRISLWLLALIVRVPGARKYSVPLFCGKILRTLDALTGCYGQQKDVMLEILHLITNASADSKIRKTVLNQMGDQVIVWLTRHEDLQNYSEENQRFVYQVLSLLSNLSLETKAADLIHREDVVPLLIKWFKSPLFLLVNRSICLVSRVANKMEHAQRIVELGAVPAALEVAQGKEIEVDGIARLLAKCAKFSDVAKRQCMTKKGREYLMMCLSGGGEETATNAALCYGDCFKLEEIGKSFLGTDMLDVLLRYARVPHDGVQNRLQGNAAIAVARLAKSHPKHLARLRELNGIDVLASIKPENL